MSLPDGPQTLSMFQTIQWIARPLEYLDACAEKYGNIFTVKWNNCSQVFLSSPKILEELFTTDPRSFTSIPGNGPSAALLGKNSALWADYEQHQRQRRLLTPAFHGERMRTYSQIISEITTEVMSDWRSGKPFSVRLSMQEISLRVILSTVFGLEQGERFEQFKQLYTSLLDYAIGSPLTSSLLFFKFLQQDLGHWSPWGRFVHRKQQIDRLIQSEIQQRQDCPDSSRTDILNLLIDSRDEVGQPMSQLELRDELMTLLFAGHESTASALAWALYSIDRLPEVRQQLLQELNSVDLNANPEDIAQLPYLTAVCQETLRLYPPGLVAIARIVKVPLKLGGYSFAPGTVLVPCIYLTHQHQEIYHNPKDFKPERFLERKFSPYEYLPFGGGHRRCIGMAFAQFEMKLVLATILSRVCPRSFTSNSYKPVRRGAAMAPPLNMEMFLA